MNVYAAIGALAVSCWVWLIFARGGFWLTRERDDRGAPDVSPTPWPSVTAIVPARDEADVIETSLSSLLAQDYPGAFQVVLVDDASVDATAAEAAAIPDPLGRLQIVAGVPVPAGWTGKLWALRQGVARVSAEPSEFLLFTDADIAHAPENVRRLVERATAGQLVLTSLMARLTVETFAERGLIPAFVFFFAMIFPFAWANDPSRVTAAAAGGCMLVRREALERAGGIEAVAGEIIDDCALAARLKRQGATWLGLSNRAHSIRPYGSVGQIAAMISRSAYAQLRFSPVWLTAALAGLALTFLAGPALALFAEGSARWLGVASWALMAAAFQPMLRFYRLSPLWGLALPLIAACYGGFTLLSAAQFWRGRGGMWKRSRSGDGRHPMTPSEDLASGKGRSEENFPVASLLIAPSRRDVVIKFYAVARMADDIADHPAAAAEEKLQRLAAIEASLQGDDGSVSAAVALRQALATAGVPMQHMLDLLVAFRRDVTQSRYADWDDLMDYCRYSAAPVGRFLLDLHGEPEANWPASDALCAALQVINHLQDCSEDFRRLDRVYLPGDAFTAAGLDVGALAEPRASTALRGVIGATTERTMALLEVASPLGARTRDTRLALEVFVIHRLARSLAGRLRRRDPLSEPVRHRPWEAAGVAALGLGAGLGARLLGLASGPR